MTTPTPDERTGQGARLTVLDTARRRYHKCAVCGKVDVWTSEWSWYGSIKDEEDGVDVPKVCSEACRIKFEEARRHESDG